MIIVILQWMAAVAAAGSAATMIFQLGKIVNSGEQTKKSVERIEHALFGRDGQPGAFSTRSESDALWRQHLESHKHLDDRIGEQRGWIDRLREGRT